MEASRRRPKSLRGNSVQTRRTYTIACMTVTVVLVRQVDTSER